MPRARGSGEGRGRGGRGHPSNSRSNTEGFRYVDAGAGGRGAPTGTRGRGGPGQCLLNALCVGSQAGTGALGTVTLVREHLVHAASNLIAVAAFGIIAGTAFLAFVLYKGPGWQAPAVSDYFSTHFSPALIEGGNHAIVMP